MTRLGFVTIGHSPRFDILDSMLPHIDQSSAIERGALDGLDAKILQNLAPSDDENHHRKEKPGKPECPSSPTISSINEGRHTRMPNDTDHRPPPEAGARNEPGVRRTRSIETEAWGGGSGASADYMPKDSFLGTQKKGVIAPRRLVRIIHRSNFLRPRRLALVVDGTGTQRHEKRQKENVCSSHIRISVSDGVWR
jgi:hypothetical protein